MDSAATLDHYLYVLGFSDGVVKVGRTCHLGKRVGVHRRDGKKIGAAIRNGWFSRPINARRIRRAEAFLIAECKQRWPIAQGLEWFAAPFEAVLELAEDIDDFLQPDPVPDRDCSIAA